MCAYRAARYTFLTHTSHGGSIRDALLPSAGKQPRCSFSRRKHTHIVAVVVAVVVVVVVV